jgi:hypothetical protein
MVPFRQKDYNSIARDILAHVTEGRVREVIRSEESIVKYALASQPVRDLEKVEGMLNGKIYQFEKGKHFRLFEDRASQGNENAKGMLEWICPPAQRPDTNSEFVVTYRLDLPSVLSDTSVGSVLRTVIEAVSREIEYLYLQLEHIYNAGFIDTASGNALDLVVSILGIRRKPDEDDESLRFRAKRELSISGRATMDAINGSLAKHSLTSNPLVIEDDEPGIVHVVLDKADRENKDLVESIQKTRAAGIFVEFHEAQPVEVDIETKVEIEEDRSFVAVKSEIEERIRDYFTSLGIGEDIRISKIELALAGIPGVVEITKPEIILDGNNRTTQNVEIGNFERAILGTITVKQTVELEPPGAPKK